MQDASAPLELIPYWTSGRRPFNAIAWQATHLSESVCSGQDQSLVPNMV